MQKRDDTGRHWPSGRLKRYKAFGVYSERKHTSQSESLLLNAFACPEDTIAAKVLVKSAPSTTDVL